MTKNILRAALVLTGITLGCGLTGGAFAQAASGTINIGGTVATACTVTVNTAAAAATLPLTTAGSQTVTVGSVVESCNTPNGYTISLTARSTLASSTTGASSAISYTASYNGGSSNALSGSGQGFTRNAPSFSTTALPLAVTFTGNPNLVAATYSDTITVTIAAR